MLAQGAVFEQAAETLQELLGVEISAKQIQRLSEHYGQELEGQIQEQASGKRAAPVLPLKDEKEAVYVMLDGSMVLTREAAWKEMKAGRLFKASSRVQVQKGRGEVLHSLYVCHLGGHRTFLQKLEAYAEPYPCKVFVCDGARWIWNWVEDCYPQAVQTWTSIMPWKSWATTRPCNTKMKKKNSSGWKHKNRYCLAEG